MWAKFRPWLAATGCSLKFFVPSEMGRDQATAEQYLLEKFDRHGCQGDDPEKTERQ
jgi:hypothetical protein